MTNDNALISCLSMQQGVIYVIKGPMRSGKTHEALRIASVFTSADKRIVYVKAHGMPDEKHVSSRAGATAQSTFTAEDLPKTIEQHRERFLACDVVLLDEAWAMQNLVKGCLELAFDMHKYVVVATLDAYYTGEPIPEIAQLCVYAQHEQKLTAVCTHCKQALACMSQKLENDDGTKTYDPGSAKYVSLCPPCYFKTLLDKRAQ